VARRARSTGYFSESPFAATVRASLLDRKVAGSNHSYRPHFLAVKHLYLLRHAKSSWDAPELSDHERPLAPRGRKACAKLAGYLRREGIRPELVLCSSSRRTRETHELISTAFEGAVTTIEDELYAADSDRLLARLRELPDTTGSVLVIAHNPGLQDLAVRLAPHDARLSEKFPTGALASFAFDAPWAQIGETSTELVSYAVPRELV
jgi:phosphohistidine phosphatase